VHFCSFSLFVLFLFFSFWFPREDMLLLLLVGEAAVYYMLVGVLDYMTLEGLESDRRRYGEVRAYG
jgi:hypothetical protein